MCSANSFFDDKEEEMVVGPIETLAEIATGTAEEVVLDDVDGKADGIG